MSEGDSNPQVRVPLGEWAEALIERTIQRHRLDCPLIPRVDKLEIRLASLIGFMVGSGLLGGAAGAGLVKMLGG